MVLAGGIDEFN